MDLPRPHILILCALLVCAFALAAPAGASASPCAYTSASPSSVANRTSIRTTACLINQERAKRGVHKLRLNGRLSSAAARHARDMVRRRYFSHFSPSGASFLKRIKRSYW